MAKLCLPSVTLCAATSVNVAATIAALRTSLDKIEFADCMLFTDADVPCAGSNIRLVEIPRLRSRRQRRLQGIEDRRGIVAQIAAVGTAIAAGLGIYVAAVWALRVPEARQFWDLLVRRRRTEG